MANFSHVFIWAVTYKRCSDMSTITENNAKIFWFLFSALEVHTKSDICSSIFCFLLTSLFFWKLLHVKLAPLTEDIWGCWSRVQARWPSCHPTNSVKALKDCSIQTESETRKRDRSVTAADVIIMSLKKIHQHSEVTNSEWETGHCYTSTSCRGGLPTAT